MNINPLIKKQYFSEVELGELNNLQNFIQKKPYTAPKLSRLLTSEIAGGDQTHVAEATGGFLSAS